ncbi:SPOR domain-containing protein [Legionella yabuuchiae]|uniref:SPOR domain-containing protein n=1 Tax=Legionella yabuuchiae TaxID=376727 RepID=UPI0013EF67C3|nr:SPOR domain-containing protein [Legionella yabuuchiae]
MSDGAIEVKHDLNKMYQPASWLAKMEFINQIVLGTNVLISVLGEQGNGKTSFAVLLQTHLDPQIQCHYFVVDPLFDEADFMRKISAKLNLRGKDTFEEFIDVCQTNQSHTLLIIDDAHHLPECFIEKLLNPLQQQGSHGYFHVCFVANQSFLKVLNQFEQQDYKEMIHTIELGHLNEKETKDYVLHRFITQPEFIPEERTKQFYQYTDGSILGINTQMASFFNLGQAAVPGAAQQSKKHYQRLSLIAGAVVVALGLAFTLKPSESGLNPSSQVVVELEKPTKDSLIASKTDDEPFFMSSIPSYDLAAVRQFLQPIELRRAELVVNNEDDDSLNDSLVVMDKVVVVPKIIHKSKSADEMPLEQAEESDLNSGVDLKIAKQEVKPSKPQIAKIAKQSSKGVYTIQLIASHSRSELERFAILHHIKDKAHIHKSKKQGKNWYVLTMGGYKDHDGAKHAIAELPQDLAKFKPWVRKVDHLQSLG